MGIRRRVLWLLCWLFLLCPLCAAVWSGTSAAADAEAGFQPWLFTDPVSQQPVDAVWFYPVTGSGVAQTSIGPYFVAARKAAKIMPGRFPLVIISHGNAGSMWSHHDLATSLAGSGKIVITFSHPGDNYRDQSGAGAASTVYGRPLQISAAIAAALHDPRLAAHADAGKIAFIGFSAGGQTGLLLGGGRIDPQRYVRYCQRHTDEVICTGKGQIVQDRADLPSEPVSAINAWVLMAPVSAMFSPDSLKKLNAPMLIYAGEQDRVLDWRENGQALASLTSAHSVFRTLPGAGHYVFLAPCSPAMRAIAAPLCEDPPGVDRRAIHRQLSAEINDFLNRAWNEDYRQAEQ